MTKEIEELKKEIQELKQREKVKDKILLKILQNVEEIKDETNNTELIIEALADFEKLLKLNNKIIG